MQLLSLFITLVRFTEDFFVEGGDTEVVTRLIDVACETNRDSYITINGGNFFV